MNSRAVKIAVSLLLTASLLCCSVSVFAYDGADIINSREYLWAYYIWQFLHSIGIDVTYQGILEYTDYVQDTIIDWVIQYIADEIEADSQPSNYTISKWVAPWQAGYDYWGNLQYNSTMLEDMEDFAEWLKSKFSLIDDSQVIVNPMYSVDGYQLYQFNTYYPCEWSNGEPYDGFMYMSVDHVQGMTEPLGYFFEQHNNRGHIETNAYMVARIAIANGSYEINVLKINGEEQRLTGASYSQYWYVSNNSYYYNYFYTLSYPYDTGVILWIPGDNAIFESYNEVASFLQGLKVVETGDMTIVTSTISMPSYDPSYTPGDGVTIVNGEPIYEEITFSGEVTNLPAIVSTGTIENPEVDQIYTNIPAFFQMANDTMYSIKQIVFRMPDEVLISIYAVLAVGVLFGFLRIMREH